ncbi:hypothetical protein OTK49_28375 [Vibrio coralliirubri]|uniref:hypothetical protein n=1 Tax=Vibrio coralliirubri TaxID=1516159 RepID=UPI002284D4AC|nr:hypothetical protein [Vibrio coralliirubri]MCY9866460.1 hypothetical protein [Vibrio coralliirubri]
MNFDCMDKLVLELKVIDDQLAFFLVVNGKQVLNEYNTNVSAFFSHYNVDATMQKQVLGGGYYVESSFYPLSCSCGVAGCNDFHDGIYQKNKKYSVEWRVEPKFYANHLSKRYYSFPITNYRYEVLKCWFWIVDTFESLSYLNTDAEERLYKILTNIEESYPLQYAQLMASRKEYEHYTRVNALFSDIRRRHSR